MGFLPLKVGSGRYRHVVGVCDPELSSSFLHREETRPMSFLGAAVRKEKELGA